MHLACKGMHMQVIHTPPGINDQGKLPLFIIRQLVFLFHRFWRVNLILRCLGCMMVMVSKLLGLVASPQSVTYFCPLFFLLLRCARNIDDQVEDMTILLGFINFRSFSLTVMYCKLQAVFECHVCHPSILPEATMLSIAQSVLLNVVMKEKLLEQSRALSKLFICGWKFR